MSAEPRLSASRAGIRDASGGGLTDEVRPAGVMAFVTAKQRPWPGAERVVRSPTVWRACRVRRTAGGWPR